MTSNGIPTDLKYTKFPTGDCPAINICGGSCTIIAPRKGVHYREIREDVCL